LKHIIRSIAGVFGAVLGIVMGKALAEMLPNFAIFGLQAGSLENKAVIAGLLALIVGLLFYLFFSRFIDLIVSLATKIENELEKQPIGRTIPGIVGLIVGLLVAFLISPVFNSITIPMLRLLVTITAYLIFSYLGIRLSMRKEFDMTRLGESMRRPVKEKQPKGMPGKKSDSIDLPDTEFSDGNVSIFDEMNRDTQVLKFSNLGNLGSQRPKVLDTSVIIDGRISDILKTGFIEGALIIPEFVLDELRHISDSSDLLKRNRGRRGLDVLNEIQRESIADIRVTDANFDDAEVDVKLLKLAKKLNGFVVTNDFNLNKVAELQNVSVLNINELANAVKPVLLPGEDMALAIVKEGKESNQGIGYLDDGTMIVVENGKKYLNETINVTVTSVLQTSAGKMIFAKPQR
jgi:uncharacterized protein YacL